MEIKIEPLQPNRLSLIRWKAQVLECATYPDAVYALRAGTNRVLARTPILPNDPPDIIESKKESNRAEEKLQAEYLKQSKAYMLYLESTFSPEVKQSFKQRNNGINYSLDLMGFYEDVEALIETLAPNIVLEQLETKNKLENMTLGDKSIYAYVKDFKELIELSEKLRKPIDFSTSCYHFTRGLGFEYTMFDLALGNTMHTSMDQVYRLCIEYEAKHVRKYKALEEAKLQQSAAFVGMAQSKRPRFEKHNRGERKCSRCGRFGHLLEGCWMEHPELKSTVCTKCHKPGHSASTCRGKTKPEVIKPEGTPPQGTPPQGPQ